MRAAAAVCMGLALAVVAWIFEIRPPHLRRGPRKVGDWTFLNEARARAAIDLDRPGMTWRLEVIEVGGKVRWLDHGEPAALGQMVIQCRVEQWDA